MGKWIVSLVNSHPNAASKRWHLWEIDLRFALNSGSQVADSKESVRAAETREKTVTRYTSDLISRHLLIRWF